MNDWFPVPDWFPTGSRNHWNPLVPGSPPIGEPVEPLTTGTARRVKTGNHSEPSLAPRRVDRREPGCQACSKCGSSRVVPPSSFDPAGRWRCWDCGASWKEKAPKSTAPAIEPGETGKVRDGGEGRPGCPASDAMTVLRAGCTP